ncbi:MAG: hypothetical protein IJ161_12315 [Bacteroidales bacterium]|nr:hypothetical protein [Bacteroidales bacterium]
MGRILSTVLSVLALSVGISLGAAPRYLRDDPDKMRVVWSYLDSLDHTIGQLDDFRNGKEDRIALLEEILSDENLSLPERYDYTERLYNEYRTYRSADQFRVAKDLQEIALKIGDPEKETISQLHLVDTYLWSGSFKEAQELLSSIDTVGLSLKVRVDYLITDLDLQYEAGFYAKSSQYFQEEYERKVDEIAEKITSLLPPTDENYILAQERRACFLGDHSTAYKYALLRLAKTSGISERRAEILGNAGFYNLEIGDTLTAVSYMTRSADMSLRLGSYQEPALRKIAESVYPLGEVQRAHRYISLAMDNATFFGSSYRIFESSLSLPMIDQDVYGRAVQEGHTFRSLSFYSIISLLVLFVFAFITFRQYKALKKYSAIAEQKGRQLEASLEKMEKMNSALSEANLLKSAYLERNLAEDSMNISLIENLVKDIELKVKARQYDDIIPYIYRNNYMKTRTEMLRRFDATFLSIFPDFIPQVNTLFNPEDHFTLTPKKDLSPELRILALTRLGIRKSVTIGEILNMSDSTVRNYKTRLRNRSVKDNSEFDDALFEAVTTKNQ